MHRFALLLLPALLLAGPVHAWERDALKPGMTVAETREALAASGARLEAMAPMPGRNIQVAMLIQPSPAQLKFCAGRLSGYSELIPGGLPAFLARAEAETRARGLTLPRFSQFEENGQPVEMIDLEWRDDAGETFTLAWLGAAELSSGTVSVEAPCGLIASNPIAPSRVRPAAPAGPAVKPVAVPPPAAIRPGPAARPVQAPAASSPGSTAPAAIPAASPPAATPAPAPPPAAPVLPNAPVKTAAPAAPPRVAVPLPPETPPDPVASGLALPPAAVAESSPPPATRLPAPRPKVTPPKPPKPAVATVPRARPDLNSTSTVTPGGRTPQPAGDDPADPEATYSTELAPPLPTRSAAPRQPATPGGPLRLPNAPQLAEDDEPLDIAPPPPARTAARSWLPTTPEGCAKSFRSYDPAKRTYRTTDGATRSCP